MEAVEEQGQLEVHERALGLPAVARERVNGARPRKEGSARSTPVGRQQAQPLLIGPIIAMIIGMALIGGYAIGLVPEPQHAATAVLIAVVAFVAGNITRRRFRLLAALSVFAYRYGYLYIVRSAAAAVCSSGCCTRSGHAPGGVLAPPAFHSVDP